MSDNTLQRVQIGNKGIALHTLQDLQTWAQGVIKSGLAPSTLNTTAKVIVATQYGMELGLSPMVAMSSIAVVGSKPTLYGDAALAMVRKSGLLENFEEWIEGQGEDMVAYCLTKRKGDPKPLTTVFSVGDAKQANLWNKRTKSGASTPWVTHPKRMLKYKARAFNLRDNFPDVLQGMHLYEELQGEEDFDQEVDFNNDVPRRAHRKKVNNMDVTPSEAAGMEQVPETNGGEEVSGAAASQETVETMLDGVLNEFAAKLPCDLEKNQLFDQFCNFAAYVLGGGRDDYRELSVFDLQKVTKLNAELAEGIPEPILESLPKQHQQLSEEEAEQHTEEKLSSYRYRCRACKAAFNEPAGKKMTKCPKCLNTDIQDYNQEDTDESDK